MFKDTSHEKFVNSHHLITKTDFLFLIWSHLLRYVAPRESIKYHRENNNVSCHRGVFLDTKALHQNISRTTRPNYEIVCDYCQFCHTCPLRNSTNVIQLSDTCDVMRHDKDVMVSVNMIL